MMITIQYIQRHSLYFKAIRKLVTSSLVRCTISQGSIDLAWKLSCIGRCQTTSGKLLPVAICPMSLLMRSLNSGRSLHKMMFGWGWDSNDCDCRVSFAADRRIQIITSHMYTHHMHVHKQLCNREVVHVYAYNTDYKDFGHM